MAYSPDREIRFRQNEEDGATGEGDNHFEDADDTLPDERAVRHGLGSGDEPNINRYYREIGPHYRDFCEATNNRMSVKPEPYDGSEDWEEYISHFEICAELGRWREEDKVLALAAALKGPARTFYISLVQTEKRDYAILIQRLEQRFGYPATKQMVVQIRDEKKKTRRIHSCPCR